MLFISAWTKSIKWNWCLSPVFCHGHPGPRQLPCSASEFSVSTTCSSLAVLWSHWWFSWGEVCPHFCMISRECSHCALCICLLLLYKVPAHDCRSDSSMESTPDHTPSSFSITFTSVAFRHRPVHKYFLHCFSSAAASPTIPALGRQRYHLSPHCPVLGT